MQEVSGHKPILGGQRGGRWRQRVEASHRLVDDGSGEQVLNQVGRARVLTPDQPGNGPDMSQRPEAVGWHSVICQQPTPHIILQSRSHLLRLKLQNQAH
jgi:hypothetical protein